MPTEKPLPDADDIIDLTDLVEEGAPGGKPAGGEAPADMSFEQELEDLFGDAEPAAPKDAAAAAVAMHDDDLIDLEGMELVDSEAKEAPAPSSIPESQAEVADDLVDLAGLDFDTPEPEKTPATAQDGNDEADDIMDLAGLGFDEPGASPTDTEPQAPATTPETAADDSIDLTDLDFDTPAAPSETPAVPEDDTTSPVDLEDLHLPELEPQPGLDDASAMDALLGELPEESPTPATPDEALDVAELADLPALEEPTEPVPVPAAAKAVAVPTPPPVTVAATASAIDLDALDKLIQTAKGPEPEPEPEQPGTDVLATLSARLDTLEAGLAGLAEQLRALPEAPNGAQLAETLADRLEATLDSRLDALRLELAPAETPEVEAPDLEALRAELLTAIEAAKPDRDSLVQDLRTALTPDFEALRQGFPQTGNFVGQAEMAAALAATRDELLAKLPEATPDRTALLDDFAELLETRLAALRQDLPGPDTYVTPKGLADALTGLRESLSVDMASVLRTAKQAARDEASAMGDALSSRIEALETDRLDPDALAEQVRQALLPSLSDGEAALETAKQALAGLAERITTGDFEDAMTKLRSDLAQEILGGVPKAAAAVIREEIAALIKEFGQ